jgi:hypothetical protein
MAILSFLFAGAMLLSSGATGQVIKFSPAGQDQFRITENTYSKLSVVNSLNELGYYTIKTKTANFSLLAANEYGNSTAEGDPMVPVLKRIIEVPLDATVDIRIVSESSREISLADYGILDPLIPAQPPVSKEFVDPGDANFKYNKDTYQKNEYLNTELVKVIPLGIMRGVRLARLEIYPVQYNPVLNKIKVYDQLDVELTFINADVEATKSLKKAAFSPFFEGIYSMVANYKPLAGDELVMDEPATLAIVSAPLFQSTLQPFIQWKTKKGFKIIEGYTNDPNIGTTTTSIKAYLAGLYNNPPAGYNPPAFILLVGDVAEIPAFSGTSGSHVTDLYYAEYTGDKYPEVFYGRFSASTLAQLQPQIDKTLEQEQYLMPDPSYLGEVVMVAGADASHATTWGNGQINYGTNNYFNAAHGMLSHTYLQPEPSGGNYSTLIKQNVSNGVGYANYTAHCSSSGWADPSFLISDIPALQNNHKYCLMVGNCCLSVKFEGTCFGEEIVRAANKGALGYIGGSNSTYWDEDYWWGVGFKTVTANPTYDPAKLGAYDRTFHDHGEALADWYITAGQMPQGGNLAVTQSGSSMELYYYEIYHLMGDPTLMAYFGVPPVTTATYPSLMVLASTTFTVTTQPYAYVAISKDGVLHGAAVADATGVAEVTLVPITVPGVADVVVTRQNGQPFIGTVVVASPAGAYVLVDDFQIDDNAGNNNGLADYGENILLDMTLKNFGSATATNLTATLTSTNPYVTITDGTAQWPNIAPNATSFVAGAFALTVADNVPDQELASFEVAVTDGTDIWNSTFNITLNAPELATGNLGIDDSSGGNGNGRLDAGETVDLIVTVNNNGHSDALGTQAGIAITSPWVTINTAASTIGTIPAGNSGNAVFNITIDAGAPIGTNVTVDFSAAAGNYNTQKSFVETIGIIDEDFETGDFSRYPWQLSGTTNWSVTNAGPYEGLYCAKSGTITHSQTSTLALSLEVMANDSIHFYYKVSSESGYDYLRFSIDGTELNKWSGTVDWSLVTFPVTTGNHTFTWSYTKDGSVSSGSDCAWIDYIVFPPVNTAPVLSIGSLTINDAEKGNGNGILDPGESAILQIATSNTGLSAVHNVVSELNTTSAMISIGNPVINLGDIGANQTVNASFNVTASSSAPTGCIVDLLNKAEGTEVSDAKTLYCTLGGGAAVEDFETGNFLKFPWTMGGNGPWTITNVSPYQGVYSAKSGVITHNQTSELSVTLNFMNSGNIKFYRKVSSESGYDYLRFFLDGVEQNKWAGTVDWGQVTFPVTNGTHILKWSYTKDGSVSSGSDCAWLDMIEFPAIASNILVDLKVNLQGPFNGSTMNTNLNALPAFPVTQPYAVAPWNHPGFEAVATVPNNNIVDWVLVELRETAGAAGTATSSTTLARQAGFLLNNGKVVGLDGSSMLSFTANIQQNLFTVVWHRNHLGVISANPLGLVSGAYTYDFTTGAGQALGGSNGHRELVPGIWGMIGGDGNADKQVNNADKTDVWMPQSGNSDYLSGDFDLNGQVNNSDKVEIWRPNSGSGCQVPN